MNKNKYQIRQGDVPLVLDPGGKPRGKKVATKILVLARGESTGHEHVLSGDVELYQLDTPERVPGYSGVLSAVMVLVNGKAKFAHLAGGQPTGEHAEIDVAPGLYWQLAQWSYSPEEIVRDTD
jgi:hypothetical protein